MKFKKKNRMYKCTNNVKAKGLVNGLAISKKV